jgi:hypothetical protein
VSGWLSAALFKSKHIHGVEEGRSTGRIQARSNGDERGRTESKIPEGRTGTIHPGILTASTDTIIPPTTPMNPRKTGERRLDQKHDRFSSGSHGSADSNFARPLGDRDEHDIHDADSTDDKDTAASAVSSGLTMEVTDSEVCRSSTWGSSSKPFPGRWRSRKRLSRRPWRESARHPVR